MKAPVIMIGVGQMGGVFARGFLRAGYPVYPIGRDMQLSACAATCPDPELVVVAVAEKDLQGVLDQVPVAWEDRLCLLQNELLPRDWAAFDNPTVISVWFEKKKGREVKVIIPSPVYGPHARLVAHALGSIDIPTRVLSTPQEMLFELVLKNVYILTTHLCGLEVGGTVGQLWNQHQELARQIADEIIELQEGLTGKTLDRDALIEAMVKAFEGDPQHPCRSGSARARLSRALERADALGLKVPTLRRLQARQSA